VTAEDVETFKRCISVGGVAIFPADTVYGLATEPDSREGIDRLYRLKGRAPDKPAAVMFFQLGAALAALPELGERTRAAVERLLPGALTLVLSSPARRYPLACGRAGSDQERLGLRVPLLEGELEPLSAAGWPVLQSSANRSGEPAPRREHREVIGQSRTTEDVEHHVDRLGEHLAERLPAGVDAHVHTIHHASGQLVGVP